MSDLSRGVGTTDVEEELVGLCYFPYHDDIMPHSVKQTFIGNAILGFVQKYGYNAAEQVIIEHRLHWRLAHSANRIHPSLEPPPIPHVPVNRSNNNVPVFNFSGVGFGGIFAFGGGLSSSPVSLKADPLAERRKVNVVFAIPLGMMVKEG